MAANKPAELALSAIGHQTHTSFYGTPSSITQALRIYDIISAVPTVLRFGGLRVVIYVNDHRPAHVHLIGRGSEAVFHLNCPAGPVELRENYGFSRRETRRIEAVLTNHLTKLCSAWEDIHGHV